jgi:hypothetical protein
LLPREFWRLSPAEFHVIARERTKYETNKYKEEWRRVAWLAAEFINISGKMMRNNVDPKDLIKFKDEEELEDKGPGYLDRRRKEAEESFRYHKSKFWGKLQGASLADIVLPPVEQSGNIESIIDEDEHV